MKKPGGGHPRDRLRYEQENKMSGKESILNAARQLFASRGFEATSTAEIARTAGISEGTIFHHFKTKDGVLAYIFEELTALYRREIGAEAGRAQCGLDAVERMVRFHFRFIREHCVESLVIFRDTPSHFLKPDSPNRKLMVDHASELYKLFSETIERGQADGSIGNVSAPKTAFILRGLLIGLTRLMLLSPYEVPELCEEAVLFCRKSLFPDVADRGERMFEGFREG